MSTTSEKDFPPEILNESLAFFKNLKNATEAASKLEKCIDESIEELNAFEEAKKSLNDVFAINSLYWCYLIAQGLKPVETDIKTEIDTVKKYMKRANDIELSNKGPRLDKAVAARFIKHALNDPGKASATEATQEEEPKLDEAPKDDAPNETSQFTTAPDVAAEDNAATAEEDDEVIIEEVPAKKVEVIDIMDDEPFEADVSFVGVIQPPKSDIEIIEEVPKEPQGQEEVSVIEDSVDHQEPPHKKRRKHRNKHRNRPH